MKDVFAAVLGVLLVVGLLVFAYNKSFQPNTQDLVTRTESAIDKSCVSSTTGLLITCP